MKIDIENKLNEKQTKELLTSIKRLFYTTIRIFSNNLNNKQEKELSVEFDNGDAFIINLAKENDNNIILKCGFYDCYGEIIEKIPLQHILNLNKYSLEIKQQLENGINNINLQAYYTEQKLSNFPIFDSKNKKLEQQNIDYTDKVDIDIENVLDEELDF